MKREGTTSHVLGVYKEWFKTETGGVTLQRHPDRGSPNKDSIPAKSWLEFNVARYGYACL